MKHVLSRTWAELPTIALVAIVAIGFLVRMRLYTAGAALWVDEAALALNVVHGSFADLMHPLRYLQGAPIGFLWLTKSAVMLGNGSEQWLRLIPWLASLLALVEFPLVARGYLSRNATLLALAMLALSRQSIYYAAELKQYSLDVLVTIGGLALFLFLRDKPLTLGRALAAATVGVLFLWTSHPSVFLLGAIGIYLLFNAWRGRDQTQVLLVGLVASAWLGTIVVLLNLTLSDLMQDARLLAYWASGFPPSPAEPAAWLSWHWSKLNELPAYALGIAATGLALLAGLAGVIAFHRRDRDLLFSLTLPFGLLLLASWLSRYPISNRLVLFLAPILAILIAQGVETLAQSVGPLARPLAVALPVILLFEPALQTWDMTRNPPLKEELPDVLAYVRHNWQQGDHIYLYHGAGLAFEYYRPRFDFTDSDFTVGVTSIADWTPYYRELDEWAQRDQRVWLVFTHVHQSSGANEEKLFIRYLNGKGLAETDSFHAHNASAYLFDFRWDD